jgi:uncharacterized membrane protein YhaH (DUF805 family)
VRRIWRRFSVFGRSTRREYWATIAPINVVLFGTTYWVGSKGDLGAAWAVAYLVLVALLEWLNVAVAVRRLHDRGQTGWWLLLLYAAPLALSVASTRLAPNEWEESVLILAVFVLVLAGVVVLGVLPGSEGPNRHGGGVDPAQLVQAFE